MPKNRTTIKHTDYQSYKTKNQYPTAPTEGNSGEKIHTLLSRHPRL